jgi:hypothetical protein
MRLVYAFLMCRVVCRLVLVGKTPVKWTLVRIRLSQVAMVPQRMSSDMVVTTLTPPVRSSVRFLRDSNVSGGFDGVCPPRNCCATHGRCLWGIVLPAFAYEGHEQYAAPEGFGGDMGFGSQGGYTGGAAHTYEVRGCPKRTLHQQLPCCQCRCGRCHWMTAASWLQDDMEAVAKMEQEESDAFAHLGTDGNSKLA